MLSWPRMRPRKWRHQSPAHPDELASETDLSSFVCCFVLFLCFPFNLFISNDVFHFFTYTFNLFLIFFKILALSRSSLMTYPQNIESKMFLINLLLVLIRNFTAVCLCLSTVTHRSLRAEENSRGWCWQMCEDFGCQVNLYHHYKQLWMSACIMCLDSGV